MEPTESTDMSNTDYDAYIASMRETEYPMLQDAIYLDHAGTTLYPKTLMERFTTDMLANLYGNPHSASPSSQLSTVAIENIRLDLLRVFQADPDQFDLVFTANATAGIKVIVEALRAQEGGFWYGYHSDAHTSLVGVREEAERGARCFGGDAEVETWFEEDVGNVNGRVGLFAWPAQSNMNGRRLPLSWSRKVRDKELLGGGKVYSLLDAAALVSTSALDLSDPSMSPDFTVLSLYKVFGFPDLGALIVRKDTTNLFRRRKYFGGGTVDMVVCLKEEWHAKKTAALHEQLEDGTLPIHSIIALRSAMQTHLELFGTLDRVSKHTAYLAERLHTELSSLRHGNGLPACQLYSARPSSELPTVKQGPVLAFNFCDAKGNWVSNTEVEKLATVKNVHLRTGGLCNPGGIAASLGLSPWEMRDNFSAGHRCGGENDILNGKPTGMTRLSLGAMSTMSDVTAFLNLAREFFIDGTTSAPPSPALVDNPNSAQLYVESLTVYPIKSCAGWPVALDRSWEVRPEGLAWDREWCIVHQGSGAALSQKRYPKMALIRPSLDFEAGVLRISISGKSDDLTVPLSLDPSHFATSPFRQHPANVCNEPISAHIYTSKTMSGLLTAFLNVPCTLARFPPATRASPSTRHSKSHLQTTVAQRPDATPRPILLSNESPILTITRPSLNRLNETIKARSGKAASPSVFRANIVLAASPFIPPGSETPYAEDNWENMRITNHQQNDDTDAGTGSVGFEFLGGCRRCQMVCVDQTTGERDQEPFVTLAKTRRFEGRVLFGVHTALQRGEERGTARVRVGDAVEVVERKREVFE
ncbi:hypothetical protein MBLNU230_g5875t1 [Neophaeotheca triangularis]